MELTIVKSDQQFINKGSCPYCGEDIVSSVVGWIEKDNGNYKAMDIEAGCQKEPDLSNESEWETWHSDHNYFLDAWEIWHPVQDAILESINKKYEFDKKDFQEQN